jgi:DNA-directed RNA polymerase specialized sigma24 family protein
VVRGFLRSWPKDDADEIAQQTFLDCLEAAARFRSADGIRSFVAAVVRHRLYAYRRRAERQRRAMVAAEEYTRRVCGTCQRV